MPTFTEVIDQLSDGMFAAQATNLLAELVEAVEATGNDGSITLTLKVTKQKRMAVVRPKLKITRPEPAVDDTMFFVDEHGGLVREDPKQTRIPGTERGPRPIPFSSKD